MRQVWGAAPGRVLRGERRRRLGQRLDGALLGGSVPPPCLQRCHVIPPYIQFELSSLLPLQRFEVSLGAIAGYQKDRKADILKTPFGVDAVVEVCKWNFGLRNQFYYGGNQMPFNDTAGLYFRAPWWQIRKDGLSGIYDGLDLYWQKSLNDFVELGVHARFHFAHMGFLGSQQVFTCTVNLDKLR